MGATQNSSYNLTRFGLPEMVACSAVLRQLDKGAQSLEEVAQRSVNWLYEHLTDDEGQRACALVRLFQTRPASALSADLLRAAGLAAPPPPVPCLVLLATAGEQPAWNAPNASANHRAIALKSAEAVADAPMIAQLLGQFGVNVAALLNPTSDLLMEHGAHTFNVFHVPVAAGSPWVPAQAEFVLRYGIQSVLGFGGVLPDGSLFATILFSRVAISPATAEQFRTLALSLKQALLPFTPVAPSQNERATMSAAANPVEPPLLTGRVATLEELLVVHEEVVLVQSQRLNQALAEVTDLNAELETRVSTRTRQLSEANDALRQKFERERLMLEINNAIASALDLPSLLRAVSACLRQVFRHDYAVMGLYDEATDTLRVHAVDDGGGISLLEEGQVASKENTPVGLAIRTKQAVVAGADVLERFPSEVVRRAVSQGLRSHCSVPLLRQNRVIGAMSITSRVENAYTRAEGELFLQIANQVAIAVENALAYREIESLKNKLNEEKLYLEEEISTVLNFEQIIGASGSLRRILKQVETVAPADSTVLIRGETGTGKELIARAIHNLSGRRERTLVKLNCAAIPTGLLESELFGHEKGAFTGAIAQRIGRFELAHKGTLFLDEVGDIPLELQPKLLRVLQEQEFERLGSARTQRVDVRVVAATNCDLEQMVADKQYRGDLFYRLNVFPITLPPLRERREDIPLLVRFFAQRFAQRMRKAIETIPAEAIARLSAYHWPGNVRELENVIERAVILSRGPQLEIPEMPAHETPATSQTPSAGDLTLAANEREHILRVLRETDWVVGGASGAAARLGMNRTTLQSRMRKLGITRPK